MLVLKKITWIPLGEPASRQLLQVFDHLIFVFFFLLDELSKLLPLLRCRVFVSFRFKTFDGIIQLLFWVMAIS